MSRHDSQVLRDKNCRNMAFFVATGLVLVGDFYVEIELSLSLKRILKT